MRASECLNLGGEQIKKPKGLENTGNQADVTGELNENFCFGEIVFLTVLWDMTRQLTVPGFGICIAALVAEHILHR